MNGHTPRTASRMPCGVSAILSLARDFLARSEGQGRKCGMISVPIRGSPAAWALRIPTVGPERWGRREKTPRKHGKRRYERHDPESGRLYLSNLYGGVSRMEGRPHARPLVT